MSAVFLIAEYAVLAACICRLLKMLKRDLRRAINDYQLGRRLRKLYEDTGGGIPVSQASPYYRRERP